MANNSRTEHVDFKEFDFDQFDDFDLGGFEDSTPTRNDRNPVLSMAGKFVTGAAKTLQNQDFQREIIKKSLPQGYLRTFDAYHDASTALSDIKYEATSGFDKLVDTTKKTIKPMTKRLDNLLPNGMAKTVRDWSNSHTQSYQYDARQAQNDELRDSMQNIFGEWDAFKDRLNSDPSVKAVTPDMAQSIISDEVSHKLMSDGNEDIARMRVIMERKQEYDQRVSHRFREKSLEIAYKTMWATTAVADIAKQSAEMQKSAFDKIIKNTALPEVVKIHNSELAWQLMKERSFGAITQPFSNQISNLGQRLIQRSKREINNFFKEAIGTVVSTQGIIDELSHEDMDDFNPNETREERDRRRRDQTIREGLDGASEWVGGKFMRHMGKRFGRKLRDYASRTPGVEHGGLRMTNFLDQLPQYFNDAVSGNRRTGSGLVDGIRDFMGLRDFAYKDPKIVRSSSLNDLDQVATFNMQARRTIIEVIPGWLSQIHNEIRMQRTGMDNLTPKRWSFETNTFEDTSDTLQRIRKRMFNSKQIDQSRDDLDEVVKQIDPDAKLSETSREALRKYIANISTDPTKRVNMHSLSGYKDSLSDADKKKEIEDLVKELQRHDIGLSNGDSVLDDIKNDFKGDLKTQRRRAGINLAMENMRTSLPRQMEDILKYANAGDMDALAKLGLVKRNERNEWVYDSKELINELLKGKPSGNGGSGNPTGPGAGPASPPGMGHSAGGPTKYDKNDLKAGGDYIHPNEYVIKADIVRQPGAREFLAQFNAQGMKAVVQRSTNYAAPVKKTIKDFSDRDTHNLLNAIVDSVQESNIRDVLQTTNELLKNVQTSTMDMSINGVSLGSHGDIKEKSKRYLFALGKKHFNPKDFLSPKFIAKGVLSGGLLSSLDVMGRAKRLGKDVIHDVVHSKKWTNIIGVLSVGKKDSKPKIVSKGTIDKISAEYGAAAAVQISQGNEQNRLLGEIAKSSRETSAHPKNNFGDTDGDGLRDNSWQDIAKRKLLKVKEKVVTPIKEKVEKKGSSLLGLITSIVGMLGGFIPAVLSWGSKIFKWGGSIVTLLRTIAAARAAGNMMDGVTDLVKGRGGKGRIGKVLSGAGQLVKKAGPVGKAAGLLALGGGLLYAGHNPTTENVDVGGGISKEVELEHPEESTWTDKAMTVAGGALTAHSIYSVGNMVTRGALGTAARAAVVPAGQALMSGMGALAGVISAPVLIGAAVVGAVAVGGYLLYKKYKSDHADMLNFRMAQYGYNYKDSEHCSKLAELEAKCLKHVNVTRGKPATFTNDLTVGDLIGIFGVDPKNSKDVRKWVAWFDRRFKPIFLGSVTVYYSMTGNTNILDADTKLSVTQKKEYMDRVHIAAPGAQSPYTVMASPFKGQEVVDYDFNGVIGFFQKVSKRVNEEAAKKGEKDAVKSAEGKKEVEAAKGKSWWEATKDTLGDWRKSLGQSISDAWNKVKDGADSAVGKVKTAWESTKEAAGNAWDTTKNAVSDAATTASNGVTNAWEGVKETAANVFGKDSANINKVLEVGKGYNVIETKDGSIVKQSGPWNWRNNNPGNISDNQWARSHGAIDQGNIKGSGSNRFAIFPTYEQGRQAKAALIFSGANYKNLSLTAAIARYAPPNENNTANYQQKVLAAVGGQNKIMSQFTNDERIKILNAMQKQEGFRPGTVTVVKKGTGQQTNGAGAPLADKAPSKTSGGTSSLMPINQKANVLGSEKALQSPATSSSGGLVSGGKQTTASNPGTSSRPTGNSASSTQQAKATASALDSSMIEYGKRICFCADSKVDISGMNKDFMKCFYAMCAEWSKANGGKKVRINSAYRSKEKQYKLWYDYKYNGGPLAAAPGKSKHEFGIAIDIASETADSMANQGILKKHGFTRPLLNHKTHPERWHLEHINFGKPGSTQQAVNETQRTASQGPSAADGAKMQSAQKSINSSPNKGGTAPIGDGGYSNGPAPKSIASTYGSGDYTTRPASSGSTGGRSMSNDMGVSQDSLAKLAMDQLNCMRSMDVSLKTIASTLGRMEKSGGMSGNAAAANTQSNGPDTNNQAGNNSTNTGSSNTTPNNTQQTPTQNNTGTGKPSNGTLFDNQRSVTPPNKPPIDLRA